MLHTIDTTQTIARLRAEIRDLEASSRAKRAEIAALHGPATGPARHALWQEKQAIGRETRAALLALAMVRGRPYRRVEPNTRVEPHLRAVAARLLGCELWPRDARGYLTHPEPLMLASRTVDAWLRAAPATVAPPEASAELPAP